MIGGIAFGWFSPSEAAALGAAGALALAAWRRRLNRAMLFAAFEETLKTSGMILLVVHRRAAVLGIRQRHRAG